MADARPYHLPKVRQLVDRLRTAGVTGNDLPEIQDALLRLEAAASVATPEEWRRYDLHDELEPARQLPPEKYTACAAADTVMTADLRTLTAADASLGDYQLYLNARQALDRLQRTRADIQ